MIKFLFISSLILAMSTTSTLSAKKLSQPADHPPLEASGGCYDIMISFSSSVSGNGPASGVATLWNMDLTEMIDSEYFEWTEDISFIPWNVCLPTGCYKIMIDGGCCINYGSNYFIDAYSDDIEVSLSPYHPNDNVSGIITLSVNNDCSTANECTASFEVNATATPGEFTFVNTSSPMSQGVEWLWSLGNGQHATGTHEGVTYTLNGLYEVCLVMDAGDCVATYCQEILVEGLQENCTYVDASITSYYLLGNGPEVIHFSLAADH